MLTYNLNRIIQLKGISRPFTYFQNLGYPRNLASRLSQNAIRTLSITKIEELCIHLNCTPNDLFEFRPNANKPLPENHALYQLKREDNAEEIVSLLHDLPIEKIRELAALVKSENEK